MLLSVTTARTLTRITTALAFGCAAWVLAGCGGNGTSSSGGGGTPEPSCTLGFLGDPAKPVELQLLSRRADGSAPVLADGGQVAMIVPPQGGRVIFIGVQATNIGACGVDLKGVLRDTSTAQVRVDQRTINLKSSGDGWGGSVAGDISSFANVPTCPNQWASSDLYDHPFELEVTLTDREGNTATQQRMVVPFCGEPENAESCACECQKDYKLGQQCE